MQYKFSNTTNISHIYSSVNLKRFLMTLQLLKLTPRQHDLVENLYFKLNLTENRPNCTAKMIYDHMTVRQ